MIRSDRFHASRTQRPHGRPPVLLALVIVLALAFAAPSAAFASDTPARKLGRGVANMTLGVLALPGTIAEVSKESGPFVGTTWGLVKGTGYVVVTEVIGVFEFMTAPFAVPPDFEPILSPEFPWDHFTGKRRESPRPEKRRRRTVR